MQRMHYSLPLLQFINYIYTFRNTLDSVTPWPIYYSRLSAGLQDNLCKWVPEHQIILGFMAVRDDGDGGIDNRNSKTCANHQRQNSTINNSQCSPQMVLERFLKRGKLEYHIEEKLLQSA